MRKIMGISFLFSTFSQVTHNITQSRIRSTIMKKTLLSPLALGAVVFAALAQPVIVSAAEPVRLSGTQMDTVTAGTTAVGVGAWATGTTSTSASTSTSVKSNGVVEIGVGHGRAVGSGSGADSHVSTGYYSDAGKVIAHSTSHDIHNPRFSFSHGSVVVIGINVPSH
jgi:hypothetical protein